MPTATPTFAIVPDAKSIATVDREIGFVPSDEVAGQVLDVDQIRSWNRTGYLGPIEVLPADEAAQLRAYFDDLLAQAASRGEDSYSISSAHLKHDRIWDLLCDRRITEPVADLLGQDLIGWGSHFFCKLPGDGKRVDWHQDFSYWPLTPTRAVTVWLAIDDADLDNGGMEVYEGSHRHGLIDFETSDPDAGNVLDQTIDHPERHGQHRFTPIPAGSMSIHSDLLIHGSAPNASDRRRCGLTLRYCPASVTAYLGWQAKGIVVRGSADRSKWPGAERPVG